MLIKVDVFITSSGTTRAFLLRGEEGSFPDVIGVGRTLPAAIVDYAACFNERQEFRPKGERANLSPSDILPSRRMVRRFSNLWSLTGCNDGQ